ncbi:MAG: glutaredoxin family protein [Gaiellales bacterium]
MRLALFVAEGCGLCHEALEIVPAVCGELGVTWEVISIDGDDALEASYRVALPVVELDGERRFEFFVDERDLRAALTDA